MADSGFKFVIGVEFLLRLREPLEEKSQTCRTSLLDLLRATTKKRAAVIDECIRIWTANIRNLMITDNGL
jgi:hypothetical protein